jgi:hypothetical protein
MHQSLNPVPLVKIEESGSGFNGDPAPEQPGYGVFMFKMEICFWKVICAEVAKELFIFPETVSTPNANFRKNEGDEITYKDHDGCLWLITPA